MTFHRLLLAATGPELSAHREAHGSLPTATTEQLLQALESADVRGRGGAGFPAAAKLRALRGQRPIILGNGCEGEPLSSKDAVLMARAPHLILDGLEVLRRATGATEVGLVAPDTALVNVGRALAERGDAVKLVPSAGGFVDGEATAVASAYEGSGGLPRHRTAHLTAQGVRGKPTLVHNVETLAQLALVARWALNGGPFPDTRLYTVSGAVGLPGVYEASVGTPLAELIAAAKPVAAGYAGYAGSGGAGGYAGSGGGAGRFGAAGAFGVAGAFGTPLPTLVGGYHGTWVDAAAGLQPGSAETGAGIVHVLAEGSCPLRTVAGIARFLSEASAGQCGPCVFGLPALAEQVQALASGREDPGRLENLAWQVDGRGACAHPDGAVRFVRSSLAQFQEEVRAHRAGHCSALVAA